VRPFPFLHEDEHVLVVVKPAGVLSVPDSGADARSVPELLAEHGIRALPVHRLDREVSGVLLLARDEATRDALQDQFRAGSVQKTYWGMASGALEPPAGELTFPILEEPQGARVSARGKPARTRYRTLACFARASELELELLTGRKNQIRVHLAHAGHALVGERKYARGRDSALKLRSRRVALHAWRLACAHPQDGRKLLLEAPLPEDLVELRALAVADARS
jgi:23S rRNA pseudouridine1911/1915/1917 synthase